jgi:hypothetical protein
MWVWDPGSYIWDPEKNLFGIPDQGFKKALDPGSAKLPKPCLYLTAGPFDAHLLLAGLGADGDDPAAQAQGQVLSVIRPGTAVDPSRNLDTIHFFEIYKE